MVKRFVIGATMLGLLLPCVSRAVEREDALAARERAVAKVRLTDEEYVKLLYRELLGREADPGGLAGYVGELRKRALTRLGVRKDIMKSEEYRDRVLAGAQPGGGNVVADPLLPGGAVALPPGAAIPGAPGGAVTKDGQPVSAEEDTKAYVTWLYRTIFHRQPDAGGLKSHVDHLLSGGATREGKLRDFLNSDEYKTRTASGEIPPYDPAKAGDYRGSLDDLFAGWTASGGPSDETGAKDPEEFALDGREKGAVQFETRGITHQENDGPKGGDFWFFVMEGDLGQIRLQHTAGTLDDGTKRAIRYYIKPRKGDGRMGIEVASDDLPGWHTWRVEWEPGRIAFFLDGRCIGEEKGLSIRPHRVMIGGYVGGGRNFKGAWRNYKAR